MTESVRLAKFLAGLISCSRREAEQYIENGWVQVDGQMVEEPGARILPHQKVTLMPQANLTEIKPVTILLHQPSNDQVNLDTSAVQLITSETHVTNDRSGIYFLKRHLAELTLTMLLEPHASGLLVFTQDWPVKRKLINDAAKVEQEYIVEVMGDIVPGGLQLLNHGLTWNNRPLPPMKVSWQNETHLRFALKAPHRGQIAHMCEQVGLKVLTMKRIRIGRISMTALPEGQWRYLYGYERF